MRKIDFLTSHGEFAAWIQWYGDFLKKLIEAKKIVKTKFEKLELIEALVLRVSVRWEVLVTENIITSLNRDSSVYTSTLGLRLRKHLSRDECKAILLGHRYLDFRSVGEIKSFGKKYLSSQYNPFTEITTRNGEKIDEFLIMRNLLSHYSEYSKRSYNNFMKVRYKYHRVPEPGDFLIGITKSGEYRWSEYLRAFIDTSYRMVTKVT